MIVLKSEKLKAQIAACRSCGADIYWLPMRNKKGVVKQHPFDAKGTVAWVPVEADGVPALVSCATYTSHFATCPNAASHRKPK